MKKSIRSLTGVIAFGLAFASVSHAQVKEVKIGYLLPLTADNAPQGQQSKRAIDMAVEEINSSGGIKSMGGAQLKIVYADTQSKPQVAVQEAERLISAEKVDFLAGAYNSGVTLPASEVAERYKKVWWCPVSSDDSITNRPGFKYARIHDITHQAWQTDVEIIVGKAAQKLAYITVPKSTSVDGARTVIETIQRVAASAGRREPVPVHVLVETHGALRRVYELAELPHVEVLDFGLMDFLSSHFGAIGDEALRSPGQFEHALICRAKADVSAAALAAGVVPAHNVCLNLTDETVISGDAKRARTQYGFQRMWSIHPAQIMPIVSAMRPTHEVVEDASAILVAAQDKSWGPIQYKGELHDRATYRYYWSILKRAQVTGVEIPAVAQQRFF